MFCPYGNKWRGLELGMMLLDSAFVTDLFGRNLRSRSPKHVYSRRCLHLLATTLVLATYNAEKNSMTKDKNEKIWTLHDHSKTQNGGVSTTKLPFGQGTR